MGFGAGGGWDFFLGIFMGFWSISWDFKWIEWDFDGFHMDFSMDFIGTEPDSTHFMMDCRRLCFRTYNPFVTLSSQLR